MSLLKKKEEDIQLAGDVEALYDLVVDLLGADNLVLKGAKLGIIDLINSQDICERVLGLEKLVFQNPVLDRLPTKKEIPAVLEKIKEEISSQMARRITEDQIERMINEKIADITSVEAAIRKCVSARKAHLIDVNMQAIRLGMDCE